MSPNSEKSTAVLGVVLLTLVAMCFATPAVGATPFVPVTVDSAGDVGKYVSMAVDGQGNPHIAYHDESPNIDLKYAVRKGGVWFVETAYSISNAGFRNSLALDAQGNPHIIHWTPNAGFGFTYSTKVGGTWVHDETGIYGFYTSLALDRQNNPHVSYSNSVDKELTHAVKIEGIWTEETVDTNATINSIALNADDTPHISYSVTSYLKYAVKIGGSWAADTVSYGGLNNSIALDAQGNPHIIHLRQLSYPNAELKYAVKTGGSWTEEIVDTTSVDSYSPSLALDVEGNPHIAYYGMPGEDLKYAVKKDGVWIFETADELGSVGDYTSLALDGEGNPHIAYRDETNFNLKYAGAGIHLASPSGGETWPVGSLRTVEWVGIGPVDIHLSVDGGNSFDLLASSVTGGSNPVGGNYILRVPHRPSRFCVVKVERMDPFSSAQCDSFFSIEASVSLLSMMVAPATQGVGNLVSWNTDPGPEDLGGYRLERRGESSDWLTLVSLTKENSYHDTEGSPGDNYRLFAVNGLGKELYLGETSDGNTPSFGNRLAVWPVPFHSGELNVSFPTGGVGGSAAFAEVSVYDVNGRHIRTIIQGMFPVGARQATWDGRDESGQLVASGIYLIRVTSEGMTPLTRKLVIVR
jgi:hypothetical protein